MGFTTAVALVHELMEARDERRLLNLQRQLSRLGLLIIDELGFVPLSPCPPVPHRSGTPLRGIQPTLRAGLHPGNHQSSLRRVDRGVRLGMAHRSTAGPPHSPRPHSRNERRELPPQAQQGNRYVPGFRRQRRRVGRTRNRPPLALVCWTPVCVTFPPTTVTDIYAGQLARIFSLNVNNPDGTLFLRPDGPTSRRHCHRSLRQAWEQADHLVAGVFLIGLLVMAFLDRGEV